MRFSKFSIVLTIFILAPLEAITEISIHGEPIKSEYKLEANGFHQSFYQTGKKADSYSMLCDMGKAIPDVERDGWYSNKPIKGLTVELRGSSCNERPASSDELE